MDSVDPQLELSYPCSWTFRVIGSDEFTMRTNITELLGEAEYTLVYVQSSRTGKYCSLQLELMVQSDEHRKGLYTALSQYPAIKAIL